MHVVMVGDHPLPGDFARGGVERVAQSLRQSLAQHAKLTFIVPRARYAARHRDEAGDIIYLAPDRVPPFLGYCSSVSRRVGREIEKLAPDVVHVQGAAGYALSWPKGSRRPPVVCTVHGIMHMDVMNDRDRIRRATANVRSAFLKQVEMRARARIGNIVVINDNVIEALPDIAHLNLFKIANPVDETFLRAHAAPPDPAGAGLRLLQVGQVSRRKNSLGAIELAGALLKQGCQVQLDLIGPIHEQEYLRTCEAVIEQLGLTGRVHFRGSLPAGEIAQYMDRSDLLVVTSQQENAPMVVSEAHCRGLPVAAPFRFGLRYMIKDGTNGVFTDRPSIEENARKIFDCMSRGFDRSAILSAARQEYDIDAITQRTLDAYRQVIQQQRAMPPEVIRGQASQSSHRWRLRPGSSS